MTKSKIFSLFSCKFQKKAVTLHRDRMAIAIRHVKTSKKNKI